MTEPQDSTPERQGPDPAFSDVYRWHARLTEERERRVAEAVTVQVRTDSHGSLLGAWVEPTNPPLPQRKGDRVVFTTTGAPGTVLVRYVRSDPFCGDLAGEWARVRFDDGETIDVRACDLEAERTNTMTDHLAHARYLGADAAMTSVVDHYMMSESDARSILDDVDPEVMDRYPEPNLLQWEIDCDESLAQQVDAPERTPGLDLTVAWDEGRDAVWGDALQATALRVLGDVQSALELERDLENRVDALRIKSEHAVRS